VKGRAILIVRTIIRGLLGLLFIWAAVSKLGNPQIFYTNLLAYDLSLPAGLLKVTAIALPWVELLCGLALLAGFWAESSLSIMLVLFLVFIAATLSAWARGLDIACGCFNLKLLGINSESATAAFIESARFAFFRNIILAALVGYLLLTACLGRQGDERRRSSRSIAQ
jgi:putative oxidoreductase